MQYGKIKLSSELQIGDVVRMIHGTYGPERDLLVKARELARVDLPGDFRQAFDCMIVVNLENANGMIELRRPWMRAVENSTAGFYLEIGDERFDLPKNSLMLWEVLK